MSRPKGSKNKKKVIVGGPTAPKRVVVPVPNLASKPINIPTKVPIPVISEDHVVINMAKFISEKMSEPSRKYWMGEARRRKYSLNQILARYLLEDFGISKECIDEFLKRKEN
jgi:hypothetical protein